MNPKQKKAAVTKSVLSITEKNIKNENRTIILSTRQHYLLLSCCLLITLFCYLPAFTNGWTLFDDNGYVELNNLTRHLSFSNLPAFFTTYHMGNYHPFAMLSLAMDYKWFGMNATGYHTHNILLHLVNVVLVFIFIWLLTKKLWAAAITALFFGIHPCHVESVAWISERKDVLYVMYYLGALICYLKYVERSGKRETGSQASSTPLSLLPASNHLYILTLLFFICSLFSKGQAVTLPVVMLLIDYFLKRPFTRRLWLEKLPFFFLSILFGIIAVYAQQSAETLTRVSYPLADRLLFSSYSLLTYIYKAVLPLNLTAFYSYPVLIKGNYEWIIRASPFLVLILFALIAWSTKFGRTFAFGFTFFLANVLLILQLFPVGSAMMADRYTYLSYTGLFFIMGLAITYIADTADKRLAKMKVPVMLLTAFFALFFCLKTYSRNHAWKDNITLFTDMLSHNPTIPGANNNLGLEYQKQGNMEVAFNYYNKAIQLKPDYPEAHFNRGNIYFMQEKYDSALADYDFVLKTDSNNVIILNNYAFYLSEKTGQLEKAAQMALKVVNADTTEADFLDTYGWILFKQKKYAEAKSWIEKALKNGGEDNGVILEHYGDVLYQAGDTAGALLYWEKAKDNNVKSEELEKKITEQKIK